MQTSTLHIVGMTCGLCSLKIEKALSKIEGVSSTSVSFVSESASVVHEGVSRDALKNAVSRSGFSVDEDGKGASREFLKLKRSALLSALLSAPLVLLMLICSVDDCCALFDPSALGSFSVWIASVRTNFYYLHNWRLQALLSFPVVFVFGWRFFKGAFYSFRSGIWGMDVLVALGASVSFAFSVWRGPLADTNPDIHLFFESASLIVTLVLFGKYLEASVRHKSVDALKSLSSLVPPVAHLVGGGSEEDVPLDEIVRGNILSVRPGEKIPADGIIESGDSSVNEAMMTGESSSVFKKAGDRITAGTIALDGAFLMKVINSGDDTLLGHIISEVALGQATKTRVQQITDRICSVFVPAVIAISLGTFLVWFFVIFKGLPFLIEKPVLYALTVLVISCPCALGLAVPAALSVGVAKAARRNILIRDGSVLENAWRADTVVFDKTGTLTRGALVLTGIHLNENASVTRETLGAFVSAAEKKSNHPLALAVASYFGDAGEGLKNFREYPGLGVEATVSGKHIIAGNRRFLESRNLTIPESGTICSEGTELHVGVAGRYEGYLSFTDELRETALPAVTSLRRKRRDVILLSGDTEKASSAVAGILGIGARYFGMLPTGKKTVIETLMNGGHTVAMVGDGINDAPALSSANLGIAMGSGTDVAMQTGDIVILDNNLESIPWILEWSRAVMNTILVNLFWSFSYNIVAIPLAVLGYLNPAIACLAMTFSSLLVIVNSLALGRKRVKER